MKYSSPLKPKLIYVFAIPDAVHAGCVKIGDATIPDGTDPAELAPNSKVLNKAAKARIAQYTKTASVPFQLLHVESTIAIQGSRVITFNDKAVHDILRHSGVEKKEFPFDNHGSEWYVCSLETARKAIEAAKRGETSLHPADVSTELDAIVFRPEQREAIDRTVKRFKSHNRMLWNAKMRFGKTLSALETARECAERYGGFRRVMILTHRPVVDEGWFEDFGKIFHDTRAWRYGSCNNGDSFAALQSWAARAQDRRFVWFASMQDLRGSEKVGGKFVKNEAILGAGWDFVIVDEAHEGTQTTLGQTVIREVCGPTTRVLALSGTPFNLLDDYTAEETFTWDYVSEQKAKAAWDIEHPGDPNPYASLPRLNIRTFSLGDAARELREFEDVADKAFTFREFFRTWTGHPESDHRAMPAEASIGDFVHADAVRRFLDLLCASSSDSRYPFSTDEYRGFFRHTLWMVPGVRAAKALSSMLREHPIFSTFEIANVAGDGDDDVPSDEALSLVRSAMGTDPDDTWSITLSCGRLTTGVTVPPWTAVFMLAGSFATDAKAYMQTIFRVQSPYTSPRGLHKEECYVFDFAPDRTLKVVATVAETAAAHRADGAPGSTSEAVAEMLNFCPIIGYAGVTMTDYDARTLVEYLERARIDRIVRRGFEDPLLYNDTLLQNLDTNELALFNGLKAVIGATKASPKMDDLPINAQGFDNGDKGGGGKPPSRSTRVLDPEAEKERKEPKKRRDAAISILRGISIRMPVLLYGAELSDENAEITIETFASLVDDASWEEFMPKGEDGHAVSKEMFAQFTRYYNADRFRAAGRLIRDEARHIDALPPLERIRRIATIFERMHNPDKETVLTPWKVVDRQLSDTLGGWSFSDADGGASSPSEPLPAPRFISRVLDGIDITARAFSPSSRILEINAKTGLYPLWCAYSVFRAKCEKCRGAGGSPADAATQQTLWDETLRENIFVVCKTRMARAITLRTLRGFREKVRCNVRAFDDFVNQFRNKPDLVRMKLRNGAGYWKTNEETSMHFNAIVGNPPYQEMGGSGGTNDASIYQLFCAAATGLTPDFVSMVIPSRWFAGGRENLLGAFRKDMLESGRVRCLHAFASSRDLFPSVEIKGGVCYYLEMKDRRGPCQYYLHRDGEMLPYPKRKLDRFDILIRDPRLARIVETVKAKMDELGETATVDELLSGDTPFGIPTNPASSKKTPFPVRDSRSYGFDIELDMLGEGQKRVVAYVRRTDIKKNAQDIDFDKIFIAAAGGSGNDLNILGNPIVAPKGSVCSQTFIYAKFGSAEESENFAGYLKTRFFRALVSARKIDQHAPSKVYSFVPVQDFTRPWTDDELFEKYGLDDVARKWIETNIREMK